MKKILKPVGIILIAALVIIQFFRPEKNLHPVGEDKDISAAVSIPANVQLILQTSCYDCHSSNTKYPWYASIQPVGWWLNDHVEEGKKEINFNEFASYSPRRKFKKFNWNIKTWWYCENRKCNEFAKFLRAECKLSETVNHEWVVSKGDEANSEKISQSGTKTSHIAAQEVIRGLQVIGVEESGGQLAVIYGWSSKVAGSLMKLETNFQGSPMAGRSTQSSSRVESPSRRQGGVFVGRDFDQF